MKTITDVVTGSLCVCGSRVVGRGHETDGRCTLESYWCSGCGLTYRFPPPNNRFINPAPEHNRWLRDALERADAPVPMWLTEAIARDDEAEDES